MGNRGIIHDDKQQVVRQWSRKPWVTCSLSFGDTKRVPFSPGNYSELFFLDEVTALAAGHRPCNTCQRERHIQFKEMWLKANMPKAGSEFVAISEVDRVMHSERVSRYGQKITFDAALEDLPDGTILEHQTDAYLVWKGRLLQWSYDGYQSSVTLATSTTVRVLTPRSIVRMLSLGYLPNVHHSAT
jgi:hypothetical protein